MTAADAHTTHVYGARGLQHSRKRSEAVGGARGRHFAPLRTGAHVEVEVTGKRNARPVGAIADMKVTPPSSPRDSRPANHAREARPLRRYRLKWYRPGSTDGFVEMPTGAAAASFCITTSHAFLFAGFDSVATARPPLPASPSPPSPRPRPRAPLLDASRWRRRPSARRLFASASLQPFPPNALAADGGSGISRRTRPGAALRAAGEPKRD